MDPVKLAWLVLGTLYAVAATAEKRDTLISASRDRVIVAYDIARTSNTCTVRFRSAQTTLGRINKGQYRKDENVSVLFFDRTGNYRNTSFTHIIPEAFMVPSDIKYEKSDDGYFSLQEAPTLTFHLDHDKAGRLSIPIYLAYCEGKKRYKVFERCGRLNIPIDKFSGGDIAAGTTDRETETSVSADKSGNEKAEEAASRIGMVRQLLECQTKVPFSDGLQYEITRLRTLLDEHPGKEIEKHIRDVLTECELRKQELEEQAARDAATAREEAERQARMAEDEAKAREAMIAAEQKKQAEEEKKRNIRMIVGGVLLAALYAAGNQMVQHIRNVKNQKSIMEMQQSIVNQAENETKRRARSYARTKTRQLVKKGIAAGKEAVGGEKNRIGGMSSGPDKRKISI